MYKSKVHIKGDPSKAWQTLQQTFINNNFSIKPHGASGFELTGPGLNSTKQNPLLGISKGACRLQGSTIELSAELGGAQFMQRFVLFFPIGLGLILALVFSLTMGGWTAVATPLLAVAPWLVLSPLLSRWIHNRTERAVETALQNVAKN
ncbi:MAG: hypothetical protein P9L94_00605 [Candidatus Hinthialibacter antarcticus]|nr:hypothetical protein [Candidatus Hinthialibacter antarcticus]